MPLQSINPSIGQLIQNYEEFSPKQIKECLKNSEKAFRLWRETPFAERSDRMKKIASLLKSNKTEYGRLMTLEMGKPIKQAESEAEKCAWACEYFADNAQNFLKEEYIQTDAAKSYVRFDPLGPVLAIMPWNFPFWQIFRFAAAALMAGNTVVLKHASNVTGCALAVEKLFLEAGFPEHVFTTLVIGSSNVKKVIANNHIKAVTLTGSCPAGAKVASTAGKCLKKVVLELGGSDPFIVLNDVDVSGCAKTAVSARVLNSGQSCIAAKRFIVVQDIAKQFEEEFVKIMESLKVGDPMDPATEIGPLAREDLLNNLHQQALESVKKGAALLTGGNRLDREGFFYKPTVLSNVTKGMPAFDEELFGPVASIIKVKDEKTAVKIANESFYGLGAGIWSRDTAKAEALVKDIEAGAVFINGIVKSDPRMPFGGIKGSGYGRELSQYGIKEFVNIKSVWIK